MTEYEFKIDHTNLNWQPTPEYNMMFLRAIQNLHNDRLRQNGYVFLNEVLQSLDIRRIPAGQLEGWKIDDAPILIHWEEDPEDGSIDITITTAGEIWQDI